MNRFHAIVENISSKDNLHYLTVRSKGHTIHISTLELPDFVELEASLDLLFKETEVFLVRGVHEAVSVDNRMPVQVGLITRGELLSQVELSSACGRLSALLSTSSLDRMGIQTGSNLDALVPSYAIALARSHAH